MAGVVVDADGYVLPGLRVHTFHENHTSHTFAVPTTDRDGRFHISGLRTGTYGLRVWDERRRQWGSLGSVKVREGALTDDLVVPLNFVSGPKRPDYQQLALYQAQLRVRQSSASLGPLATVDSWVRSVLASPWWQNNLPHIHSIEIKDGHSGRWAYGARYPGRDRGGSLAPVDS